MKVSFACYELETAHALNAVSTALKRQGALIKINFHDGKIGYADCHPWPELGDLPLKQQLERLACQQLTPITYCAVEFAKIDAEFRFERKEIFKPNYPPYSHLLISNILECSQSSLQEAIKKGFTHIKVKMGRQIEKEIECLHALFLELPLKLRLDFNETLSAEGFHGFLKGMDLLKEHVDFIEDPFPFHPQEWKEVQQQGWALACDRQAPLASQQPESARILIIKPAVLPFNSWQEWKSQRCIVTSYLGHPLGQIAAAVVAAQVDPDGLSVHGLLSHYAYKLTPFSRELNWKGPQFKFSAENSFVFDHELQKLDWIDL